MNSFWVCETPDLLPHTNSHLWNFWDAQKVFGVDSIGALLLTQTLIPCLQKGGSNSGCPILSFLTDFYFSPELSLFLSSISRSSSLLEHPRFLKKKGDISLENPCKLALPKSLNCVCLHVDVLLRSNDFVWLQATWRSTYPSVGPVKIKSFQFGNGLWTWLIVFDRSNG